MAKFDDDSPTQTSSDTVTATSFNIHPPKLSDSRSRGFIEYHTAK